MKHKLSFLLLFFFIANLAHAQQENFILGIDVFTSKIKGETNPHIIDVRTAEEFAINHITNAVNVDLSIANYRQKFEQFSKKKPLFIYSINVSRSGKLARELLASGYKEVYVLKGGIANWIGSNQLYYSSAKNKLTKEEFTQLTSGEQPVLIEFMSRYCGACKRAGLIIDSLQKNRNTSLKVVKIDINDNHELVANLNLIHAVPTLALYLNNTVVWKKEGIESLEKELTQAIAKLDK